MSPLCHGFIARVVPGQGLRGARTDIPWIRRPSGDRISYFGVRYEPWSYIRSMASSLIHDDSSQVCDEPSRRIVARYRALSRKHDSSDLCIVGAALSDSFEFSVSVADFGAQAGVPHEVVSIAITKAAHVAVPEPLVVVPAGGHCAGLDLLESGSDSYLERGLFSRPKLFAPFVERLTQYGVFPDVHTAEIYYTAYMREVRSDTVEPPFSLERILVEMKVHYKTN